MRGYSRKICRLRVSALVILLHSVLWRLLVLRTLMLSSRGKVECHFCFVTVYADHHSFLDFQAICIPSSSRFYGRPFFHFSLLSIVVLKFNVKLYWETMLSTGIHSRGSASSYSTQTVSCFRSHSGLLWFAPAIASMSALELFLV